MPRSFRGSAMWRQLSWVILTRGVWWSCKLLVKAAVTWGLLRVGRSCPKVLPSHAWRVHAGHGQQTSIPLQGDLSVGLLECLYNTAAGFQKEWATTGSGRTQCVYALALGVMPRFSSSDRLVTGCSDSGWERTIQGCACEEMSTPGDVLGAQHPSILATQSTRAHVYRGQDFIKLVLSVFQHGHA